MFPIWRTYIKRSNDIVIWLQKQFNRSLERLYVYTSLQSSSRIGIHNVEVDHFIENTETSKYPTAKEYYICMELPWWSWIIPSWVWCGEGAAFLGGGGLPIHPRRLFLWISRVWRMIWRSPIGNSYTVIRHMNLLKTTSRIWPRGSAELPKINIYIYVCRIHRLIKYLHPH